MKKVLISICVVMICMILGTIIYNSAANPDTTEMDTAKENKGIECLTDQRVKEALDSNRNYVMEENGLNIPFSAELLFMLEEHFDTALVNMGAGLYCGALTDHASVELLCNAERNIGQIQVRCDRSAPENELRETVMQYSKLVNPSLEHQVYQMTVDDVVQIMRELPKEESRIYFNHGIGFGLKSEDGDIVMYIP